MNQYLTISLSAVIATIRNAFTILYEGAIKIEGQGNGNGGGMEQLRHCSTSNCSHSQPQLNLRQGNGPMALLHLPPPQYPPSTVNLQPPSQLILLLKQNNNCISP